MDYLLGVDGGNTKTDYLLVTTDGEFADILRAETCSHEAVPDGYDGMERAMSEQLGRLMARNKISFSDIKAAGFGLAGADFPSQTAELTARIKKIGLTNFRVSNDGILGIKGALEDGIGLCAVNGTGTVVLGSDEAGQILQVGGIGPLSGDNAGGGYISSRVISRLYDYYYRCGSNSSMFPKLLELFNIVPEGIPALIGEYETPRKHAADIIRIGDDAASAGDSAARDIFDSVGSSIAHSVAGCVKLLTFEKFGTSGNPIDIVLVGSIWSKVNYKGMRDTFISAAQSLSGKHFRTVTLNAPPALGGVLWAKEISCNAPPSKDFREKVLGTITQEKYDELVYGA